MLRSLLVLVAAACLLPPAMASAQIVTGALIGTVKDEQGAAVAGARIRLSSPALIGGPVTVTTSEKGQLRFPVLHPGSYVLDIEMQGFAPFHEEDIRIGVGATFERIAVLKLAGIAESVVVEGASSRIDARDPGYGTRFGPGDLKAIPTRRSSLFDFVRAAPGISPTSPASGTNTGVSAFGSSTNENTYLIDGTNFTSPSNGGARADPAIDVVQELHVQSVGASVEYGNLQGAVINIITRQGGNTFLYDASYYGQTASLTSQPVRLPIASSNSPDSGYERVRYRDFTTNLGGPAVRDRLWFFAGYQYLRDYDSQPGTDPKFVRTNEQDKVFAKLTWRLARGWQFVQSIHDAFWVSPEQPTIARPYDASLRMHGSVPTVTFGLTRTSPGNIVWDVRVGRFVASQKEDPSTGNRLTPSRLDQPGNVTSGAPPQIGELTHSRTTAKATFSHYRAGMLGVDHDLKLGGQVEKGEHNSLRVIPTGTRFVYSNGLLSQAVSSAPSNAGGAFISASAFVSSAVTIANRLALTAGMRFDHSRAISQDLRALDSDGRETTESIRGLGTLYTWNVLSPRLGVTAKLSTDGRTLLRASYGMYHQGVLTGELSPIHPGVSPVTTVEIALGSVREVDPKTNLQLDRGMRPPRTDASSIGIDRELGRGLSVALSYIRKNGRDFIGWVDTAGQYREETRTLADGRSVPAFVLVNSTAARRFQLTNPAGYSLTYNGLVMAVEARRSRGWSASGSYTLSRAHGLQPSSGTTAGGAQLSTVGAPPISFGRDPNDLTNALGRLPNDRPHMGRLMSAVDVPRTGLVLAAHLQYFSGKPWAATAAIPNLPQNSQQRILLEPRGTRRLSSQTLLDVRLSKTISLSRWARVELLMDVLNALNDTAEESLVTDDVFSLNFGKPNAFMDPRRAMLSVRMTLAR